MGPTLQQITIIENRRVLGSRSSRTAGKVKLVIHFEMLADKRMLVEAGKAINVFIIISGLWKTWTK